MMVVMMTNDQVSVARRFLSHSVDLLMSMWMVMMAMSASFGPPRTYWA